MQDSPSPSPWRTRDSVLLAALAAGHVALLAWAAHAALSERLALYEPRPYLRVGLGTLLVCVVVMLRYRRRPRLAAWSIVGIAAVALFTPGVVLVVALGLVSAWIVGRRMQRSLRLEEPNAAIALLSGLALAMGVLGATAALKMHYAPLYVLVGLAILAFGWRDAVVAIAAWANDLRTVERPTDWFALAWTVLLTTVVVLHLFIVAKPEVGYDANTVHLQVPLIIAQSHRFSFDVGRHAWAVMPLGADWLFAAAHLVGGEAAARLANFCFGAIACFLMYELIRREASRRAALAVVTLFACTPLAFLESGSLFVENLWLAYLLAMLAVALRHGREPGAPALAQLLLLAAGAMQCKVLAVPWLVAVLAGVIVAGRGLPRQWRRSDTAWSVVALVIGVWPYGNAWMRTGNPVFPYFNSWFHAAAFDTGGDFFNALYRSRLTPWTPYDMIVNSAAYIEGSAGAAGFVWLLVIPLVVVGLVRAPRAAAWAVLALAAFFFVAVYSQQSYLRYLLPAFALLAVLGGWSLATLPRRAATSIAVLGLGIIVGVLQLRLIYTASWTHAWLCPTCSFDPRERERYIATFIPDRVVGETLNRLLPTDARVGFFMPNAPNPAGFVGYARQANWHDFPAFEAIVRANDAQDLMRVVRRFALTHVVCRDPPGDGDTPAIRAFCRERIDPLWRAHGRLVGAIKPNAE